ncbi:MULTISPECIES: iron-siderophore ABC transporter substrate-binding protein [unclassified Devosia]|jgi:iron complex transport system substrate-binding protein|uniref:iron-siderophore ABC transporter substrate-binding protein n=1 Tax=unclassified Devosia TaxID=196773 RepID=UPI000869D57D|nr:MULTISPECIES: iron-siderophore ABC transporter substrate-binding protein [unclassified Devosia]MBN9359944.1 iron-siderophore ABC transporter substrate-binding protein [Devosia sp.]ODS94495.1 MAG: iron ABC transporter substrate-binding protein [Devosia sp. SCN 66-27]OJX22017.1 MAG: iron ABC transporter substrate-binding protein [Devosia sp. 66-14]
MFRRLLVALVLLLAAAVPALAQSFPVTIRHALGETVIEQAPQRIVTWGWGNHDALLALGVVPVAMPFSTYGGGDNGLHPWVEERLKELGAATPVQLSDGSDIPFEQIAAQKPDVIIAVFSGLNAEQYARLSQIAPTVAYPDQPWSTPWQDVTKIIGQIVGKPAEAEQLVADTLKFVADETAKYPEIAGTTFAGVNDFDGSIAVYDALDARMKFLTDIGLVLAPSVTELSPKDGSFFYPLSYELFDQLKSDILITYYETQAASDEFFAKPYAQSQAQYQKGAFASLVGVEYVAAVSPPSALSLRWGFPHYAEIIAAAARNARK